MRVMSVMLVVCVLALAGCGSSSSSSSSSTGAATAAQSSATPTASPAAANAPGLATAKFIAHAGLAFGAFHRYIYKPLRAGEFKGLLRHKLAVVKATAAAAFIFHELKLASADAKSSPALASLVSPLQTLSTGFAAALAKLRAGRFNLGEIETANLAIDSIAGGAKNAGVAVNEQAPSLP